MKNRDEHHKIQSAIVEAARYIKDAELLYAIPNGGKRDKITAAKLKREGVLAGIPDLCLPVARVGFHSMYHALYIEVKTDNDDLSDSQRDVIKKLSLEGNRISVVRSAQEGIDCIRWYLSGHVAGCFIGW